MIRMAVPLSLFTVTACSSGSDRVIATIPFDEKVEIADATDAFANQSSVTPQVWISSAGTLRALIRADREHRLELEVPIKVNSAHIDFRNIELDTASVLCKSIDQKSGCWVARLEMKDVSGSRYWSISTYDTAFSYRASLVVEEWRASRSLDTMFLAGQVWYYSGEKYPLDYRIRTFDPQDSLMDHPDNFDAKTAVGYTICNDGSIRCCPIPKNFFHRPSEMRLVVPDTCLGC